MASERAGVEFGLDRARRIEDAKNLVFEYALAAATLAGIVSLLILGFLVLYDALGLSAASPGWVLAVLVALVAPTGAYVAYARANAPVWNRALVLAGVLVAGGVLATVGFAVPAALGPRDVFVYYLVGGIPTAAVYAYGRYAGAGWTGPALPVVLASGVAAAGVFFGTVRALVHPLADWVVYYYGVALPAAVVVGYAVERRFDGQRRPGLLAAGTTMALALAAWVPSGPLGYDPAVPIVVTATLVVPVGVVIVDTAINRREGLAGLGWPLVVGGGIVVGSVLTDAIGAPGPEPWLTWTLLSSPFSTLFPELAGIYPQLVGSILLVSLMAVLIFPVGVGAAVYLEEYAPRSGPGGRLTQLLQVNIANLAGVPSVVYGLLGLGLFVNFLGQPRGLLVAGSVTLGLLILPIVIVSSQEALRSVPDSRRQAAYGMGASRWQMVRNVVLPEAFPGILTGTILALGRAIGETAPILIIGFATSKTSPPTGLFEKATALPLQIFASRSLPQPEYRYGVLAAAVVVLLGLLLVMNASAIVLRNRYQRRS